MTSGRTRFLSLFVGLCAVELAMPRLTYGFLYARLHGRNAPVFYDDVCWQLTVQFVGWFMGCTAVVGVAGCGYEWLRPRGGWLVRVNVCRQCGHGLMSDDLYCPACASGTTDWDMPDSMMSHHARESARRAAAAEAGIPPSVLEAAQFLVSHAKPVSAEAAASLEVFCLGNATLQRRLYFAAALRLHPDRNNGELLHDWQRLQQAVRVLRDHLNATVSVHGD